MTHQEALKKILNMKVEEYSAREFRDYYFEAKIIATEALKEQSERFYSKEESIELSLLEKFGIYLMSGDHIYTITNNHDLCEYVKREAQRYIEIYLNLEPIELPSDEEIEDYAKEFVLSHDFSALTNPNHLANRCFQLGAKWMKEQILGKEDKTFKQKSKWTEVDNMTRRLK